MAKKQLTVEDMHRANEREKKRSEKASLQKAKYDADLARTFSKHWKTPPVGRLRMLCDICHPKAGLAWDRGLSKSGAYFTSAGSYMPRGSLVYEIERFLTEDGKHGPLDQGGWGLEVRSWSQLFVPGVVRVTWLPSVMELVS